MESSDPADLSATTTTTSSVFSQASASNTNDDSTTYNSTPVSSDPLETAKWTRYLPETFGIRESVRQSSYRWCVREG
jgi:hypothetical protein